MSRSGTAWVAWGLVLLLLGAGTALYRQPDPNPSLTVSRSTAIPSTPTRVFAPGLVPTPQNDVSAHPTVRTEASAPVGAPTSELTGESDGQPTQEPKTVPVQAYWRAGFCMSEPTSPSQWAERLGASWYLDWQATESEGDAFGEPKASPPEHWRMVRTTPEGIQPPLSRIRNLARQAPGSVWIIGNEPDVIWQDNLPPEDYAVAYGQVYDTIKVADPTALVAVGGVSQGTLLRFQYLDRVLGAYQGRYQKPLPADWWTVHGYVLREEHASWGVEIPPGIPVEQGNLYEIDDHGRLDIFEKHLRDFRAWMAHNGYQEVPLALTEFGILMPVEYGFPPEFVAGYLRDTFHLLETMRDEQTGYPSDDFRLVQRWAWYSLSDPTFATSDLADLENDRLTLVGQAYRDTIPLMRIP